MMEAVAITIIAQSPKGLLQCVSVLLGAFANQSARVPGGAVYAYVGHQIASVN